MAVSGLMSTVLFSVCVFLCFPSTTSATVSHNESYTSIEYQTNRYYSCYSYTYTYCYNWYHWRYWYWGWSWCSCYYSWYVDPFTGRWGYWPVCQYRTAYDCYWAYRTTSVTVVRYRCQEGWSGSECDIPSCDPVCTGGQVCTDVNYCECLNSTALSCSRNVSSRVQAMAYSLPDDCYPGITSNGICHCPAGFGGAKCEDILLKPTISSCKVKLYVKTSDSSSETVAAEADCEAEELEPQTTWVGGIHLNSSRTDHGLTNLVPVWTTEFTFPLSSPTKIGIAETKFSVNFSNYSTGAFPCLTESLSVDPVKSKSCNIPTPWNQLSASSEIRNNMTFTVNIEARLGGRKTGENEYDSTFLRGPPVHAKARFQFDLNPPTHCLLDSNDRDQCVVFPIYLDQDIRTNPIVEPKFLNWNDKESGIDRFHVEVYYMQPDADDLLTESGDALVKSDVLPHLNNFRFIVPKPGVYSIHMTAFDKANNSARARKIFNFNDQPSFKITEAPVFFQEAEPKTNVSFVSRLDNRRQLTLVWTGRFIEDPLRHTDLLKPVKPWPVAPGSVDDTFGTRYGRRSVNAVDNATGVASIIYGYSIVGRDGIAEPSGSHGWHEVDRGAQSVVVNFNESLRDGDTVVLWLKALDVNGNVNSVEVRTVVDTSGVNVTAERLEKDSPDWFSSTVFITAVDLESGINSTDYRIYDVDSRVTIVSGNIAATKRDHVLNRRGLGDPCPLNDTTCYCTPVGDCFPFEQRIYIDHVDISRYGGHSASLVYKISNRAGIETSQHYFDLGYIPYMPMPDSSQRPLAAAGGHVRYRLVVIGILLPMILVSTA